VPLIVHATACSLCALLLLLLLFFSLLLMFSPPPAFLMLLLFACACVPALNLHGNSSILNPAVLAVAVVLPHSLSHAAPRCLPHYLPLSLTASASTAYL